MRVQIEREGEGGGVEGDWGEGPASVVAAHLRVVLLVEVDVVVEHLDEQLDLHRAVHALAGDT